MIHLKVSSPSYTSQRKKRQTNSGRTLPGSARSVKFDEETISTEPEEPVPIRYSDIYKQKKAQAELGNMLRKKKSYTIAPDALIPNSTCRTVFKRKEIKPVALKEFQLRLDILDNLQNNNNQNSNEQDDDEEWAELDDPDAPTKPASAKKTKGVLVSRQKESMPDLFKRLQNEPWWKQPKEDKPDLTSILNYLKEILKLKQIESYESACYYITEIFRIYGIETVFVNQILDILLDHLTKNGNDKLDICTVQTIAKFMIERKDIIVRLLEYAIKSQSNHILRSEIVNSIKFITDVNNSDEIDLVIENISVVYNSSNENFSLKAIIRELAHKKKVVVSEGVKEGEENDEIHPLLKKISEERWFPRGHFSITLDFVLDAIITKLPDATKTMIKTLTTHFIQLHRVIGYSQEQFDRVSNALMSLLSHVDADYRLIAATNLANLDKETKAIDIALLNSFLNDPRILVRTECCDTLKKLTGIMSDTVLKDCADDMTYLQTLSEENFTLQNYLNEKNRLPTPPTLSTDEQSTLPIVEEHNQIDTNENIPSTIRSRSPSPQTIEQSTIIDTSSLPIPSEPIHFSTTSSVTSSVISVRPSIRVEISEKRSSVTSNVPTLQKEQTTIPITRQNKQSTSPIKSSNSDPQNRKRSSFLPIENLNQKDNNESEMSYIPAPQSTLINEELINDPIQTILEEHKQNVGYYRMNPLRRLLIPHKISMENILVEQLHIMINNQYLSQSPMNLSDLNHNQYQLVEVEFVQLLSSLVIRAIQIHKHHEKFIPTSTSLSFTNALSVSPSQLHSSSVFQQSFINSSPKLPGLGHRPTSKQFTRMQTNIQAKALREGINVHKAQNMEGALSNLLKSNRETTKSTMFSSSMSHSTSSRQADVTHALLLVQLLKSRGISNPEFYLQKILQAYPKFTPLLHTKIPQSVVSIIWNDPVLNQLASIFGDKRDHSSLGANSSMKRSDTKQSVPLTDDEYSLNGLDYSTLINRDDQKKKFLPIIRGSKMNLPRHVLKFGFRQIDVDPSELLNNSPWEQSKGRSRKRRVQMHLMMSSNENTFDRHESNKSPERHMYKTDYQTTSYVPIVTRPPMCH